MAHRTPLDIRYERHISRTDTCWLWTGSVASSGYPQFRLGRSNATISVHRWAYERWVGPILQGQQVLHHCDVRRCSNPAHLYCGTAADNARDATARGRRAETHAFGARKRKLTDDDVRAIRNDTRRGHEIAAAFDISETHVHQIKTRKRKAHVADGPTVARQPTKATTRF